MKQAQISELKWKDRFTYKKIVPFDLGQAKFQIIKFEPKKEIKPHYHLKTIEVFMVIEGYGILKVNGKDYPLEGDFLYLIEPKDSHAIYTKGIGLTMAIFKPIEGGEEDIYWGAYSD